MLSNALSREKLDSNSLVKILWPREKCRLIKDDVILVDRYRKTNRLNKKLNWFLCYFIFKSWNRCFDESWLLDWELLSRCWRVRFSCFSWIDYCRNSKIEFYDFNEEYWRISRRKIFYSMLLNVYRTQIYFFWWIDGILQLMSLNSLNQYEKKWRFIVFSIVFFRLNNNILIEVWNFFVMTWIYTIERMLPNIECFVSAREALLNRNTNANSPTRGGYNDGKTHR